MQGVADQLEQCAEGEGETAPERQDLCNALRSATEALNHATTPFAGRRMDSRVRSVLSGQRIDELAA